MPLISKVTRGGQVSIPWEIRKALNIVEGTVLQFELVEGKMTVVPMALIPADQAWFWTKAHQQKERETDEDLKSAKYKDFSSADSLMQDLKRGSKRKKAS